jgi:hypothetical protein
MNDNVDDLAFVLAIVKSLYTTSDLRVRMTNGTAKWNNNFEKLQLIAIVAVEKQSKSITPNSNCEWGYTF